MKHVTAAAVSFGAERAEARDVLRFAASVLTPIERFAMLASFVEERSLADACQDTSMTRQGVQFAKQRALAKMRRRLLRMGVRSSADLFSYDFSVNKDPFTVRVSAYGKNTSTENSEGGRQNGAGCVDEVEVHHVHEEALLAAQCVA